MATARKPVKALNKSADVIKAQAAAEKARKAASKKALREATKTRQPDKTTVPTLAEPPARFDHRAEDAANALKTAAADAKATGITLQAMLEAMGIDAHGYPIAVPDKARPKYSGPMLALRAAAKGYATPANGNACCGDPLAAVCGDFERKTVVAGLLDALGLKANPYAHLNPGQQSMNLRNKTRAALSDGRVTMAQIKAALNTASKGLAQPDLKRG